MSEQDCIMSFAKIVYANTAQDISHSIVFSPIERSIFILQIKTFLLHTLLVYGNPHALTNLMIFIIHRFFYGCSIRACTSF